jgi:hypothetical protein
MRRAFPIDYPSLLDNPTHLRTATDKPYTITKQLSLDGSDLALITIQSVVDAFLIKKGSCQSWKLSTANFLLN